MRLQEPASHPRQVTDEETEARPHGWSDQSPGLHPAVLWWELGAGGGQAQRVLRASLICVFISRAAVSSPVSIPASSAPPCGEGVGALTRAVCGERLGMEGLGQVIPLCLSRRGNRAGWLISFRGDQSQSPWSQRLGRGCPVTHCLWLWGTLLPDIFTKDRGPGEAPCSTAGPHPKSAFTSLGGPLCFLSFSVRQAGAGGKEGSQAVASLPSLWGALTHPHGARFETLLVLYISSVFVFL